MLLLVEQDRGQTPNFGVSAWTSAPPAGPPGIESPHGAPQAEASARSLPHVSRSS